MLPIIPATVIGSWSFPGWYAKFCEDVAQHPDLFGADDREEALRDAVRLAIDDQLRAGADIITDGEMQRVDFNLGFYDYLDGIEPLPSIDYWVRLPTTSADKYCCIASTFRAARIGPGGRISPAAPVHGRAGQGCRSRARSRWRAACRAATSTRIAPKSPRPWCRSSTARCFRLQKAGVDFIQLDEPSFACHPNRPRSFSRPDRADA